MNYKLIVLPLVTLALGLAGCARIEQWGDTEDNNNNESEEQNEEEQNEEEQERQELINNMPEEAHTDDWNLILVNNWRPLPDDFDVELTEVDNEQEIDERIVDAWDEWNAAASEAGHNLFFASGYRSVERQTSNYENSIEGYIEDGYSEEEAVEQTEEYIAIPEHSEHHTGLALDIVDEEWIADGNGLVPEYETQESQEWLVETMSDYGFILRYPEEKEEITDIEYEPWHFRYVGVENAAFMEENDLVLEEYHELLEERQEQETDEE